MTTLRRFAGPLGVLSALTICFFLESMEHLAQVVSTVTRNPGLQPLRPRVATMVRGKL
jgi:hypothetical protein